MLWGFSPALDLLDELSKISDVKNRKELNFLIIGAADARHVLKTMSKYYTHDTETIINFYVLDVLPEFIARQMLLLTIALEPSDKLGLLEKTHLWMEVYANSLLRPSCGEYVVRKSVQMVHMVTDGEFLTKRMPCINLELLKYKEKDNLEYIFKYWMENDFNVSKDWDDRLRSSLRTRYDAKLGVFDWDFQMKLRNKTEAEKINVHEHKQWRNTGLAFTWLEKEYTVANPTFALGIFPQGDKLLSHGYCGDMDIGPYFTFGVDCEDENMLKTSNGQYRKRSTDLAERNIMRMMHELEHQQPYVHEDTDETDMGLVVTEMAKLKTDVKCVEVTCDKMEREDYSPIPVKHVIYFIPLNSLEMFPTKDTYKHFFDLLFVSQGLASKVTPGVVSMGKPGALLIFETRLYFYHLRNENLKEFKEKIKNVMNETECTELGNCNFDEQSLVRFKSKLG